MTLRTTSLKRQYQAWTLLAFAGLVAYIALVRALGLGNPILFFGSHQMRVFLPLFILLRLLSREFRWDGVVRKEEKSVEKSEGGEVQPVGAASCRTSDANRISPLAGQDAAPTEETALHSQSQPHSQLQPPTSNLQPPTSNLQPSTFNLQPETSDETAEALWERAREMVHGVIPDPDEDDEYLNLVTSAAERGHVPALAKLGDYAFRRGAFVEAYFWTKMARRRTELSGGENRQSLKEIDDMLCNIRREWAAAGQPEEFENVYENFPEERGELGRAFLRLDVGIEVWQTRDYIRCLAEKGNPDAALFAK